MKKILGAFLISLFATGAWAGATFSRVKTWSAGETLTAADLNAEFNNLLTNLTPGGVDDYSASNTEMRTVTDPYPASSESLATSLSGEVERMRYQILEIKKAMQASNVTYWYQDLPTAGFFTNTGTAIGIGDTTPDYTFDVEGGTIATAGNIISDGNITTTGDDVDFSTHVTISGNLTVSGGFTGLTMIVAKSTGNITLPDLSDVTVGTYTNEEVDTLSEWNGTTFTVTNSGNYCFAFNGGVTTAGTTGQLLTAIAWKNGAVGIGTPLMAGSSVRLNSVAGTTNGVSVFIHDCAALSAGDTIVFSVSANDTASASSTLEGPSTQSRLAIWRE